MVDAVGDADSTDTFAARVQAALKRREAPGAEEVEDSNPQEAAGSSESDEAVESTTPTSDGSQEPAEEPKTASQKTKEYLKLRQAEKEKLAYERQLKELQAKQKEYEERLADPLKAVGGPEGFKKLVEDIRGGKQQIKSPVEEKQTALEKQVAELLAERQERVKREEQARAEAEQRREVESLKSYLGEVADAHPIVAIDAEDPTFVYSRAKELIDSGEAEDVDEALSKLNAAATGYITNALRNERARKALLRDPEIRNLLAAELAASPAKKQASPAKGSPSPASSPVSKEVGTSDGRNGPSPRSERNGPQTITNASKANTPTRFEPDDDDEQENRRKSIELVRQMVRGGQTLS